MKLYSELRRRSVNWKLQTNQEQKLEKQLKFMRERERWEERTPVIPVYQGWWYIQSSLAVVGWLMKFIKLSCTSTVLPVHWMALKWCWWAFLNVCTVAAPYAPILLPTKAIGMQPQGCVAEENRRETRKKASTENQRCLGWKGKGTKGVRRVEAGWLSLVTLPVSYRSFHGFDQHKGGFQGPGVPLLHQIISRYISPIPASSLISSIICSSLVFWKDRSDQRFKGSLSAMLEFDNSQLSFILSVCTSVNLFCRMFNLHFASLRSLG